MPRPSPNKLLVEGDDEKRVIPYFMDEHIVWGDRKDDWAVRIESFDGVEDLLKPGVIEAESKEPGLQALGILVDADDHLDARWEQVRKRCLKLAPDFPKELPPAGLIHPVPNGPRIGVWIMPDNQTRGMLETFLALLVPGDGDPLVDFAADACRSAKQDHGATFGDTHEDKARIHTYLAWLDPPGRQLHVAVLARALDARLPLGLAFARWFMELFQIPPRLEPLP